MGDLIAFPEIGVPVPVVARPLPATRHAVDPPEFIRHVALHRMGSSWTACDSCEMALAVWMVRSYEREPPMHAAASAIWLVCDGCVPPGDMCVRWRPDGSAHW